MGKRGISVGIHLFGVLLFVLMLLPLWWAFVASLAAIGQPPQPGIAWFPYSPHWQNYVELFRILPLARYLGNTLFVLVFAIPLTVISASLAALGLTLLPQREREFWLRFSVGVLFVPAAALWMLRFQILRALGLLDSLWALILPAFGGTNPLFVLLFYWAFRRVPREIWDAARIDGANTLHVWWRVALPLARPAALTAASLAFVFYWSDFSAPLLYIFDPKRYPAAVALQILRQLDATNWQLLMAAAVLMTLPVLLLFAIAQRWWQTDVIREM
ncbi:MAG: carbohydrate ABC transporter permease [Anaerolineales bacterium]